MSGLTDSGADIATLTPQQLHPVDQFHAGGLKALKSLLSNIEIKPGSRVLDLGCGLGGTCRVIASEHPTATVLGVDVTPEFIDVSRELTSMVKMEGISFEVGSATDIPVGDASIDLIVMVYVGKKQ
jgi:ubiquinone/menaquinone biosynthesis C-methylase UbiE